MRTLLFILCLSFCLSAEGGFSIHDVWVDVNQETLGAYKLELKYSAHAKIVGLEGGEEGFHEPPFHDKKGLSGGRIILAALSKKPLIKGKVKVAQLHFYSEKDFQVKVSEKSLIDVNGKKFKAKVVIKRKK